MSKGFSEHERSLIKQRLIESCKECWGKYGYKKTSVGDLSKMAGISTGAFYLFYSSKELLFMDTAQIVGRRLLTIMNENRPENPTKYDFVKGMKLMYRELEQAEWLLSISSELEVFLRKLPTEFMEQDFKNDFSDFSSLVEKYGLTPKKDMDIIVVIFQIILLSVLYKKNLPFKSSEAIDLMIDTLIENLFE